MRFHNIRSRPHQSDVPSDLGLLRKLIAIGAADAVIALLIPERFTEEQIRAERALHGRQASKICVNLGLQSSEDKARLATN